MFISLKQFFVICFVLLKTVSGIPVGFLTKDGRIIVVEINDKYNWIDALSFCAFNGGQLAAIETEEMNEAVTNLLKEKFGTIPPLWLGANDEFNTANDPKRRFFWSRTGRQMVYNNWGGTGPTNVGGNEHCAAMYPDFKWKAAKCEIKMGYICECISEKCVKWAAC